jgi:hypothetical protein
MQHISKFVSHDFKPTPIVKDLPYRSQKGINYSVTIYDDGSYLIHEPDKTVLKWVKNLNAAYTQSDLKKIDPGFMQWLVRQLRIYYDTDLKVFLNQSCD